MWARLTFLLLVALALPGSAVPSTRSQADVSFAFQNLGTVLTGPAVGLPPEQGVSQPSASVLPDGRIRLYYSTVSPAQAPGTFSAISADGLHFTPEPGQRWFSWDEHIERLSDGRWRLYYSAPPGVRAGSAGIASAISGDGLSFTPESGLRLVNPVPGTHLSCCGIVGLADGRYRMYTTAQQFPRGAPPGPPDIYSAVSSNLVDWAVEPGVRLGGRSPAALLNPDGSTVLVVGVPPMGIETATSADGLTFASHKGTNLAGDFRDPAFVTLPDGRLLMYFDTGDPPTIGAAIAVRVSAPTVSYPSSASAAITATSARVSAIVDPQGAMTSYAFEYGNSTAYGDSTDLSDVPATNGQQTVSATLAGLTPATTYHFRVDAYNSVGTANGADETFRTAAATCRLRPARDRGWEVALAHAATRTSAATMLRQARKVAKGTALVERDGCADYETAIAGLTRKGVATALRRAKRLGFRGATLERT